jgi:hypothetical protein
MKRRRLGRSIPNPSLTLIESIIRPSAWELTGELNRGVSNTWTLSHKPETVAQVDSSAYHDARQ